MNKKVVGCFLAVFMLLAVSIASTSAYTGIGNRSNVLKKDDASPVVIKYFEYENDFLKYRAEIIEVANTTITLRETYYYPTGEELNSYIASYDSNSRKRLNQNSENYYAWIWINEEDLIDGTVYAVDKTLTLIETTPDFYLFTYSVSPDARGTWYYNKNSLILEKTTDVIVLDGKSVSLNTVLTDSGSYIAHDEPSGQTDSMTINDSEEESSLIGEERLGGGDGDITLPVSATDEDSWVETWDNPVYMGLFHYTTSARSDVHLKYKNSNGDWIEFDTNYWKRRGSYINVINDDTYGIELGGWCWPWGDCTYTWNWYTDANGNKCYTVPTGGGGDPTACFEWSPEIPDVGETVTFDASCSEPNGGSIDNYAWDLDENVNQGDDKWGKIVTWTYPSAGTYTVKLWVHDTEGNTDIVRHDVTVGGGGYYFSSPYYFKGGDKYSKAEWRCTASASWDANYITGRHYNYGEVSSRHTGPFPFWYPPWGRGIAQSWAWVGGPSGGKFSCTQAGTYKVEMSIRLNGASQVSMVDAGPLGAGSAKGKNILTGYLYDYGTGYLAGSLTQTLWEGDAVPTMYRAWDNEMTTISFNVFLYSGQSYYFKTQLYAEFRAGHALFGVGYALTGLEAKLLSVTITRL